MKIWALAGLFTVLAAPNAFALGALTDAPPEPRELYIAVADTTVSRDADAQRQRLAAKQGQPTEERARRREEAENDPPARPRAEQRRRRNGALDRFPDAVLIERSGAL